jgi:putative membrane protein
MAVALAATAGAQQPSSPRQGSTQATAASRTASTDTAFAMKAAQANMAEVELGKLAEEKAQSADVKKFGQQMVSDHGKSLDELKSIASTKSLALPAEIDAEHKALSDRLSKLNGAAFDRAYVQAMVDGHKKVAAEFRKQSQSGTDAELKAYAAKTLPAVEEHLKHAQTLSKHGADSTH